MIMRKLIVLLDNGHGKETPGKRSPKWTDLPQIFEWEYNRLITAELEKKLKRLDFKVHMVTPEENDVPLHIRTRRIREWEKQYGKDNCITLSIHLNAADTPLANGWEAHTYLGFSKSDEYSKIFYDSAERYFDKIRKGGPTSDPDYDSNFAILRDVNGPAVLTENLFMTNKEDCKILLSEEGKQKIINLHIDALLEIDKKL